MVASDCTALYGPAQDGYEYGCQANACVTLDVNECLTGEHECDQGYDCASMMTSALMNVPTSTNATAVWMFECSWAGYTCSMTCEGSFDYLDVNECVEGTDNCGSGYTCSNTVGREPSACQDSGNERCS